MVGSPPSDLLRLGSFKNYQLTNVTLWEGGGVSPIRFTEAGPYATTQIPEGGAPEKSFCPPPQDN